MKPQRYGNVWQAEKWSPKDVHIRVPRTCGYVVTMARGLKIAGEIKVANQLT